ncbi:cytochrome p450 monooxygenase [Apiospora rasikravindrae]|uniref:Cytochrome p450 monooxygenase n=1 Tax=Apiospora rasikravindrae TaxID=990691 RepID=A0ABR1TD30_9PEZI
MDIDTALGTAFATGVLLHASLFRIGEWDLWGTQLMRAPFVLLAILSVALTWLKPAEPILQSFKFACQLDAALLGGIFVSMLVYRAFFHRLRAFPGPFAARLSSLYMTRQALKKMQPCHELKKLHDQYGEFVRIGPMELSITEPAAFRDIYANSSPCEKGPVYSHGHPSETVVEIRSRKRHAPKRKLWDYAFTTQALNDYEDRIERYTNQLLGRIEEQKGAAFDIRRWFSFYTFDVMGELAFGKSFRQLEDNVEHYMSQVAHEGQRMIGGVLIYQPWFMATFRTTPILNRDWLKLQSWSDEQIKNRLSNEPEKPDIFHWVSSEYRLNPSPTPLDKLNLKAEIRAIVIAGSDTTSMTLVGLFYHLVKAPRVLARLRDEIDGLAAQGDQALTKNASLAKLGYLQACIDESLRLLPVVPTRLQRMTPPEGVQIGSRWIPGNTTVIAPSWILCRDPRCFARPEEFIPERWTTEPDLVLDASVYAPFSIGRTSCAGKQLALIELRRTVALILHRYDFALAPEQRIEAFESGLEDHFTLNPPEFKLVFKAREVPSLTD